MRMFNRWHANLSGGSRNRSHWGKLKNWNQTNPEITVSFSQMLRRQLLAISCPSSWLRDMQVTDPGQADGQTDSHPETLWSFVYFPKYKSPRGQRPRALLTQEQGGHRGLFLGSNQDCSCLISGPATAMKWSCRQRFPEEHLGQVGEPLTRPLWSTGQRHPRRISASPRCFRDVWSPGGSFSSLGGGAGISLG